MPAYNVKGNLSCSEKGGAFMQAFLIFSVIFFGIFGAAVFIKVIYSAFLGFITRKGKERERGGK